MTALLDANVLIALVVTEHVHHDAAAEWLSTFDAGFATCPITQGSLVRFLVRTGQSAAATRDVVGAIEDANRHEFWPDSISFADVEVGGVVGAMGRIVAAVFASMAEPEWSRLKLCSSSSCRWAFYDRSRNHSSRWCTMASCGNREKARRFRAHTKHA